MTTKDPKRDIVLYFSAGAMSGVFSAGFSKELGAAGMKKYIHSVYGNSSGGLTSLCFASGQEEQGAALYWEDLDGDKYIRWSRLPRYVLLALSNAIFRTKFHLEPVFDIEMIEHILLTKRKIDYQVMRQSGMKIYLVAYNLSTAAHEFLHIEKEEDVIPCLKATGGGHPAYPHSSLIHGNLYIDGGTISDEYGIFKIIERHPDKEIVCVFNNPASIRISRWRDRLQKMMIGVLMLPLFGFREARKTAMSNFANINLEKLQREHPFVHIIGNDLLGNQFSTDPNVHKMLYKRGQELAREFLLSRKLVSVSYPLSVE